MTKLERFGTAVSALNDVIGRTAAWLGLALVLLEFAIVVMRYVFGLASLFMREGTLYIYATLFLLAASYALRHDAHVRIGIFYERMSARSRAAVDLAGTLVFLVPVCVLVLWTSIPYVAASWATLEGSIEASGIPAVFLLKTVIPVFAVLVLLQGLANAALAAAAMARAPSDPGRAD